MRLISRILLPLLISTILSCGDEEEVIVNRGAFVVDGEEYPIEKAMLLSNCAVPGGDTFYLYLLFMPGNTTTKNMTCDNVNFEPAEPDWISMGITVANASALDEKTYTFSEPELHSVRLHAGETSGQPALVDAWLSGEMKVIKSRNVYTITLDFTFTQDNVEKTLKGNFYGRLTTW